MILISLRREEGTMNTAILVIAATIALIPIGWIILATFYRSVRIEPLPSSFVPARRALRLKPGQRIVFPAVLDPFRCQPRNKIPPGVPAEVPLTVRGLVEKRVTLVDEDGNPFRIRTVQALRRAEAV